MRHRPAHLAYVVWGFPPGRGGGVYRALATANTAARLGARVTVLCAPTTTFERHTGTDMSLLASLHPRVTVERVPFSWPAQEIRVSGDGSWSDLVRRFRRRALVTLSTGPFPEPQYGNWRRPLTDALLGLHRRDPVDLTLASANPHVAFAAAWQLWRAAGVPYAMDYRDAWSLDVFTGQTLHRRRSRVGRWERRLIADAREIWFVNERILKWHQLRYPDAAGRMRVVTNGWDPDRVRPARPRIGDHPLVFGYLGTISRHVPIAPLLEGWARSSAGQHGRLILAGHAGYFRSPDPVVARMLVEARARGAEIRSAVPAAELYRFYEEVDVLVLALGSGHYVTSGKVFEYLATGRPIVAIQDPGNASATILAHHPDAVAATSLEPDDVAAAIDRAAVVARCDSDAAIAARVGSAQRYRRDRVLEPALKELLELGNDGHGSPGT